MLDVCEILSILLHDVEQAGERRGSSKRPAPCDCCNFGHSADPDAEFSELEKSFGDLTAEAAKNEKGKSYFACLPFHIQCT